MRKVDFDSGTITQNILQTAFPMLIAQVLNLLYSIIDRVYIGRIPGEGTLSLGAVGICFPIIIMITGFTNMFGMGGAPLFAIETGAGNREKARMVQNTSLRLLLLTAAAITVSGELFCVPLLRLFGATDSELSISASYLRIYLTGTLPLMVSTGMNPFLNAQGFALAGMVSVGTGALANLILDPLFIFVFGMGVKGAALATVLSQLLSLAVVLRFLLDPKREFPVALPWKRITYISGTSDSAAGKKQGRLLPYAADIIGLGLAPFIMQVTNSLVQIACNNVLMKYGGVIFISVMTIVSSVRSILDVPVMAISEGASPIISYNYGARRSENVRRSIRVMMRIAVPYTLLTWAAILLVPSFFIRIFSTDAEILSDASRALRLYFAAFIFQSLQYCGQTVFKALNKRKQAIFFSLLRKVVLVIPLTLGLPRLITFLMLEGNSLLFQLHATDGVFLAEPVSNVVGGTACFITMLLTVMPELAGFEKEQSEETLHKK